MCIVVGLIIVQASVLLRNKQKKKEPQRRKYMLGKGKNKKLCLFCFLSGRGVDCVLCEWSCVNLKKYFEGRNVG